MNVDFTDAGTLHKLAQLPFYGYAEAIVRRIDPYWHAPEPPYEYAVTIYKPGSCSCCGQSTEETKKLVIEAPDADEAERIALHENRGWYVGQVDHPKFPTAAIPDAILKQFEKAA